MRDTDLSYIEDFRVRALAKSKHPRNAIEDGSSAILVMLTTYKTRDADISVFQVHPRESNPVCSGCGEMVMKSLNVRVYTHRELDIVLDRTYTASLNILRLA